MCGYLLKQHQGTNTPGYTVPLESEGQAPVSQQRPPHKKRKSRVLEMGRKHGSGLLELGPGETEGCRLWPLSHGGLPPAFSSASYTVWGTQIHSVPEQVHAASKNQEAEEKTPRPVFRKKQMINSPLHWPRWLFLTFYSFTYLFTSAYLTQTSFIHWRHVHTPRTFSCKSHGLSV